jgi:chemotaxis protein histidine kinase CheA
MAAHEYSDTLKVTRATIDMWDLMEQKRNGIRASTKKIRRLMRLTGKMTAFQENVQSIGIKRKQAMSAYKKVKKQASKEREQLGKQLIKARAKARNTTVAAQERQLPNAFGQRKLAQHVK